MKKLKTWLKNSMAISGYRLGFTQAITRLSDYFVFNKLMFSYSKGLKKKESFLILMYHRVKDNDKLFTISTTPKNKFDQQMAYVSRHFNVLSLNDILDHLKSGEKLPKRCISITFDDGYEDNYLNAFPTLLKYNIPATIFLTVGCIETGAKLWFDRVLYAFEQTLMQDLKFPLSENIISFQSSTEKFNVAIQTLETLKELAKSTMLELIDMLYSELKVEEPGDLPNQMLNWTQIREMSNSGISIGSHTLTHPILSNIPLKEAEIEITVSKNIIESYIDKPAHFFAYPNGRQADFNEDIISLIKKAGYQLAVTTQDCINLRDDDRYKWSRISPWEQEVHLFAFLLGYYLLKRKTF